MKTFLNNTFQTVHNHHYSLAAAAAARSVLPNYNRYDASNSSWMHQSAAAAHAAAAVAAAGYTPSCQNLLRTVSTNSSGSNMVDTYHHHHHSHSHSHSHPQLAPSVITTYSADCANNFNATYNGYPTSLWPTTSNCKFGFSKLEIKHFVPKRKL